MLNVRFFIFFLIKICTNKFVDFFLILQFFYRSVCFLILIKSSGHFSFFFWIENIPWMRFLNLESENISLWVSVYQPNNLLSHKVRPFLLVPDTRNIFFRYSVMTFRVFGFLGNDKEWPDEQKTLKLQKNQRRVYILTVRYTRTDTKKIFKWNNVRWNHTLVLTAEELDSILKISEIKKDLKVL